MTASAYAKLGFLLYCALEDDLTPELCRLRCEVYFALSVWPWHTSRGFGSRKCEAQLPEVVEQSRPHFDSKDLLELCGNVSKTKNFSPTALLTYTGGYNGS